MWIIEDSRQQAGKHELKHKAWADHGDKLIRCALPFGDYMAVPPVSVDTKASMQEVAQNIGGSSAEHNRFRRELIKAQEAGCHLYILVENDEGIREGHHRGTARQGDGDHAGAVRSDLPVLRT